MSTRVDNFLFDNLPYKIITVLCNVVAVIELHEVRKSILPGGKKVAIIMAYMVWTLLFQHKVGLFFL